MFSKIKESLYVPGEKVRKRWKVHSENCHCAIAFFVCTKRQMHMAFT